VRGHSAGRSHRRRHRADLDLLQPGRGLISRSAPRRKRTGRVAGNPEYEGWVLITKDERLPWLPQTLADRLDEDGEKRQRALTDARRRQAGAVADDAAGGITWVESRNLERRAQAEARSKNTEEATRLRARSRALAIEAREIRQAHMAASYLASWSRWPPTTGRTSSRGRPIARGR